MSKEEFIKNYFFDLINKYTLFIKNIIPEKNNTNAH